MSCQVCLIVVIPLLALEVKNGVYSTRSMEGKMAVWWGRMSRGLG